MRENIIVQFFKRDVKVFVLNKKRQILQSHLQLCEVDTVVLWAKPS